MTIDSSGNVGVGTASPTSKLHLGSGDIRLENGNYIVWGGLSNGITGNAALNLVSVYTNGTERLRINSEGNVGIGTTSPATKLTVSGSSGTGSELRVVSTTANTGGKVTLYENTSPCWEINAPNGANGSLTLKDIFNNAERLRIDSSGNVGIGTASPAYPLVVSSAVSTQIQIKAGNANASSILFGDTDSAVIGRIQYDHGTDSMAMWTNSAERLRIDSSGNVGIGSTAPNARLFVNVGTSPNTAQLLIGYLGGSENYYDANTHYFRNGSASEVMRINAGNLLVGKTAPSTSTVGFQFTPSDNKVACGAASGPSAFFNRNTDDGIIVQIAQDGTVEGTISVSGTTVSYNGGHLSRFSQLPSGQRDPAIKKGTVLSNLDAMCEWRDADGNLLPNEQLNKVKISDVEGDSNTAGVFVNWDNDDQDNPYDLNMAMTGDMIIRIAQGTSVNRGDLLMSAGDGTAKPQGDDIIRSKTIAKVTSTNVTCTYEDGSYCVPCVLMAC
jgi:hypothetical protein